MKQSLPLPHFFFFFKQNLAEFLLHAKHRDRSEAHIDEHKETWSLTSWNLEFNKQEMRKRH